MPTVKLAAPWVTYFREIEALFGVDPQINVEFDDENLEIRLYVEDATKAEAIEELLPAVKEFGNVKVNIKVIPANLDNWKVQTLAKAFKDNPAFIDMHIVSDPSLSNPMCFVTFKKEVVQYYNDRMDDLHGLTSTLYQEIAKDLFDIDGVYFCTDNEASN